jgi:hypothetical protein
MRHHQLVDATTAQDRLYRQAALWLVEERGMEPVVRAACDALVAGVDSENLRSLAAISVHASDYDSEADDVIHAALAEQGKPLPERGSTEAQEIALRAMAEEVVEGMVAPRALAEWAHRVIGHSGVEAAQGLVGLDDVYDELTWAEETEEDVDRMVLAEAQRVISRPSE